MNNQEKRIEDALRMCKVIGIDLEGGAPVNAQTEYVMESGINGIF